MLLRLVAAWLITACGTTGNALKAEGHTDAYVIGFQDGRHSCMRGLYRFVGNRTEPDAESGSLGSYATVTLQPEPRDFNGVGTGYQRADVVRQRLLGISATYNF